MQRDRACGASLLHNPLSLPENSISLSRAATHGLIAFRWDQAEQNKEAVFIEAFKWVGVPCGLQQGLLKSMWLVEGWDSLCLQLPHISQIKDSP